MNVIAIFIVILRARAQLSTQCIESSPQLAGSEESTFNFSNLDQLSTNVTESLRLNSITICTDSADSL